MTSVDPIFGSADRRSVVALVVQRMVINTASRMVFTFLPALSAGSGLSVQTISRALFLRDMAGLGGPLLGRVVARFGSWRTMAIAGLFAAIGMALMLLGPIGVFVGLVLWGLCRTGFIIGINTWLSSVVSYKRRGRASGLIELTWAASAFIGLPMMGLLIDAVGWWAAPMALALAGIPVAVWMVANGHRAPDDASPAVRGEPRHLFSINTWLGLSAHALLTAGAQFLWFTHGLWLAETYDFRASQVGFAIILVGLAEAVASSGTAVLADRLGKAVSSAGGGLLLCTGLLALGLFPTPPLVAGLAMLVVAFLGFEFAIVSSIPLISELEPLARSRAIGMGVGMSTVGRAVVSLIAGWIYVTDGFRPTAFAGAGVVLVAVIMLAFFVREPDEIQDVVRPSRRVFRR